MTSEISDISTYIWDSKYRFKNFDGAPIDMTPSDTFWRVANALAGVERGPEGVVKSRAREFFDAMSNRYFTPAGRIIAGAGTGRNITLSNCFTMGTIPDSMDGIFTHLKEAALTMQQGGGIGYDFSTIRPKGSEVKGVAADASGPLSFMDVWDAMCRTVMSAGSRRGAMMATMRCDHPDIQAFVDAKKDPTKLRMFNLSVLITDDFMKAVKDDTSWRLHFENRRGETISEKTIMARDLWNQIMENTYAFADPGVIFIDRVNADHNLGYLETIATTNPCGEKPMGPYASCLLGSINLAMLVKNAFTEDACLDMALLGRVVKTAIRMMDNVIEAGQFPLESQAEKAHTDRQLGLGVTGLADALIMCGLVYGSLDAAHFTEEVMRAIALAAYNASVDLAIERGPFPSFDAAKFLNPKAFAGRVLDSGTKARIHEHGIRNSLLVSIAPTGTISMFAGNVSSGIEPVFAYEYDRKILQKDGSQLVQHVEDYAVAAFRRAISVGDIPCPENMTEGWDPKKLPPVFVSAQTLTPEAHIRMQAAAQKWVDSSISKTVNCPEDISFDDFKAIYELAFESGCKGCTTYRPNAVTGSILSVKEEPKDEVLESATFEEIEIAKASAHDYLRGSPNSAKRQFLSELLKELGVPRVSELKTREQFLAIMGLVKPDSSFVAGSNFEIDTRIITESGASVWEGNSLDMTTEDWPEKDGMTLTLVVPDFVQPLQAKVAPSVPEGPEERPDGLPAAVYKLKWPGSDHAVYITITDIVDRTGHRRPFEMFINSKNMEHFAWTVALTRMISAIFRRPHDSRFVVEELKAVFDPKGGAWLGGKFVPSILAAIGGVIERHMQAIGYMDDPARADVGSGGSDPDALARAMEAVKAIQATREVSAPLAMTMPYGDTAQQLHAGFSAMVGSQLSGADAARTVRAPGPSCPACSSFNVKVEGGCPTCLDCGYSKCG